MATRSTIAVVNSENDGKMIYCHANGYPQHMGFVLHRNYKTVDEVTDLINKGDHSEIDVTIDESTNYHDWRGEPWVDVKPREFEVEPELHGDDYQALFDGLLNHHEHAGAEYCYVFYKDKWLFTPLSLREDCKHFCHWQELEGKLNEIDGILYG